MAVRESPQLAELCYQVYGRPHAVAFNRRHVARGLDTHSSESVTVGPVLHLGIKVVTHKLHSPIDLQVLCVDHLTNEGNWFFEVDFDQVV